MTGNPLGRPTVYPPHYQPDLLVRIPRQENRQALGIDGVDLPFTGADIWNAYEISCLDSRGKPMMFQGRFVFPVDSPYLVESKSLKLYLVSLNQEKRASRKQLADTIRGDLSHAAGKPVAVMLWPPGDVVMPELPAGISLDDQDLEFTDYRVARDILAGGDEALFAEITDEVLFTNLFRSNCPVTGQPDWATVTVCYHGRRIPRDRLLKYLVSYRQHNDYHENCIERIFRDLTAVFSPMSLTVEANFLRRGGLDINPVRTTESGLDYSAFPRHFRQ